LGKLRGAVMIVYPMGLPPHDPIKQEFEDTEDLSGTQVLMAMTGKTPPPPVKGPCSPHSPATRSFFHPLLKDLSIPLYPQP
jgi:hypothetical protein